MDAIREAADNLDKRPEAEAAVIGTLLLDSTLLSLIRTVLPRADMFWYPENVIIYQAIMDLHDGGLYEIDMVVMRDELKERKLLKDIGGVQYLVKLASSVPTTANAEYYAEIVKRCYVNRELIIFGGEVANVAIEEGNSDEKIGVIQRKLNVLLKENIKLDATDVSKTIAEVCGEFIKVNQYTPTGFIALDNVMYGYAPGDYIVIGARPAMGKSALMMDLAMNQVKEGRPVLIFSLEMSAQQLQQRMLCNIGQVNARRAQQNLVDDDEIKDLALAAEKIKDYPLYVDSTAMLSPEQLFARTLRAIAKHKIEIVFVDYLQLMSRRDRRQKEDRYTDITYISKMAKATAMYGRIPLVMISQLNRDPEKRKKKRPKLSDLRDSGSIEQDADVVLLLYRQDYYEDTATGIADINIAKNRRGPTGNAQLIFVDDYVRFASRAVGDEIPI